MLSEVTDAPVQWIGGGTAAILIIMFVKAVRDWLGILIGERREKSAESREEVDRLRQLRNEDVDRLRTEIREERVLYETELSHLRKRVEDSERREHICQARVSDLERSQAGLEAKLERLTALLKVDG